MIGKNGAKCTDSSTNYQAINKYSLGGEKARKTSFNEQISILTKYQLNSHNSNILQLWEIVGN